MKTALISLIALLYVCPSFTQEPSQTDAELTKTVVGTWQHVSSTKPNGTILRYERQIELFADGTGTCIKTVDGEKVTISFNWDVVNGAIMLYIYDKKGKRITTDSQLIWDIDANSMNLACTWESDDYGRSSLYKRKKEGLVKF